MLVVGGSGCPCPNPRRGKTKRGASRQREPETQKTTSKNAIAALVQQPFLAIRSAYRLVFLAAIRSFSRLSSNRLSMAFYSVPFLTASQIILLVVLLDDRRIECFSPPTSVFRLPGERLGARKAGQRGKQDASFLRGQAMLFFACNDLNAFVFSGRVGGCCQPAAPDIFFTKKSSIFVSPTSHIVLPLSRHRLLMSGCSLHVYQ